ncbi:MAG: ParB/RepB/Spo0J family partition protein [Patescibacteria group bacterium]
MAVIGIEKWNPQFLMMKVKHLEPPAKALRTVDPTKGDSSLRELSQSIADVGIIQPVLARPKKGSLRYETVCGDRRRRAAKLANLHAIPVIVADISDGNISKIRLIENLHREDLSPIELAEELLAHKEERKKTLIEIAAMVHKSESWVSKVLSVAKNLGPKAKKIASSAGASKVGMENLYQVSGIPEKEQPKVLQEVIDEKIPGGRLREQLHNAKDRGKEERKERSGRPRKEKGYKRSFETLYGAVVSVSFPEPNPTIRQIIGVLKQVIMKLELKNI